MILEGTCGFRHLTPQEHSWGCCTHNSGLLGCFPQTLGSDFVWAVRELFLLFVCFFSILNRKIVKLLSKAICIFKDCIYFPFCCSLLCTHSYLWCRRNSQDVGRAHASAVGVHEQQVWLLTQRWAGRQLLFSTRCQTFQSVVPALVHPLPFPDKTMWKCQSEQALVIT